MRVKIDGRLTILHMVYNQNPYVDQWNTPGNEAGYDLPKGFSALPTGTKLMTGGHTYEVV